MENKMSLWQIDNAIMEGLDFETGEVTDFERLEQLTLARDAKIEGVALYIKSLQAAAAAIRAEEIILADRRREKERKIERLKEYLTTALDGAKFETPRVKMSFRSSTSVEIVDELHLLEWLEKNHHDECVKYKLPEIRVSEVGKLLKDGKEVPGASLVTKSNLQLK